jgi:hypothetical protein
VVYVGCLVLVVATANRIPFVHVPESAIARPGKQRLLQLPILPRLFCHCLRLATYSLLSPHLRRADSLPVLVAYLGPECFFLLRFHIVSVSFLGECSEYVCTCKSGNRCNRNPHMCRLRDRPRIYPRCVARPKWLGLGSGRFWGLLEACSFQRGAERCFKWQCVNTSRGISPRTMPFDGGSSFIPCNEFRESRELFHER